MEEIRCGVCSPKLGEGVFTRLVIKCPRCGAINLLRIEENLSAANLRLASGTYI